ncbi:SDR family oxidoreductase [Acinetobacter apis]|uniref:2,3-dihydro-2,3-dihydroxybenzoate dehydrogenase n=1 Tax=Acinetobacter apis TaxID=1229165 RepID=A0A217EGQ9_9GAMM|nr:SDR family oxidoreductase [Acinetobacter apis]SNQ29534.1 2,3-dihydro-2,3-dihydroxybenzoate dehydrogenase [Acinetobacter apis]
MGSTIVVTGAARGIGAAIALKLLEQDFDVIGIDIEPDKNQWEVKQKITEQHQHRWHAMVQDITEFSQIQKLIQHIVQHHHVVGLVNVAGILKMTSLLEATLEDWQSSIAVNLQAPIVLSQYVAQHLVQQGGGSIVTVSSNSARMARTQLGLYATTKAALSHFCRNLGLEVAPFNVRVNVVSPGSTLTQMQKQLWTDEHPPASIVDGDLVQFRTGIPLKRMAQAEDIAHAVVFLLSEQASQITMQEIVVDGGATLGV